MTAVRDFLFELGTEELPPLALPELERALAAGIRSGLAASDLRHGEIISYAAPRRLAVLVRALAEMQPEQVLKRRGPPVNAAFDKTGQPTRAATAFAESCGVTIDALGRVTEGKGEFLWFEGSKPGATTVSLLPGIVQAALDALPIPKRMRWGASDAEFVRPVHWVLMRFGAEALSVRLLDTVAGSTTRGHRFHAPGDIAIAAPADYADVLRAKGHVIANFAERRARIHEQVLACAQAEGGRAVLDDELLDEVTALVEWPVAVEGRFDERFLALPREVLISTLQEHQRYFAVENAAGVLTNRFITISNIDSREPSRVREGNERVVRPRLSDAAFFQQQDRRQPLAAWRDGLDKVTFQAKLGSIGDKLRRAAIGVFRIVLEGRFDLDLAELVAAAVAAQPVKSADTASEVLAYVQERMRAYYLDAGFPAESFDAVLATGGSRPLDFEARMQALASFRKRPEAESLAAANKRIANILKKSAGAESAAQSAAARVDASLLSAAAERALHEAIEAVAGKVESDLAGRRYDAALETLAGLRPAIDAFFTDVMVNDPDPA
ncbi:MAG: glycine--tRNA ligase subunit beta, partial [Gammaproteobacteria bacterium]|nr:glycine--tRNA ligase subunit beta [Gammaproteobacteria bacterium]